MLTIALPDIHGRADLLEAALNYYPSDTKFVFLGDAIDRGPASRGAVQLLLALHDAGRAVLLRGNHESMLGTAQELFRMGREHGNHDMITAAKDEFENWQKNGGASVINEYGDFGLDNVPEELSEFIGRTELSIELPGGVLCVHAAPPVMHPEYPTSADTALWARPTDGPFPMPSRIRASIHGHTPLSAPTWVGKHLYTDLGAVFTGAFCTVDLESFETTVLFGWGRVDLETLPQLVAEKEGVIRVQPFKAVEV